MDKEQPFIDYYHVLQVSPNCDPRVLEMAYHHFAKMYHPDRRETADVNKLQDVIEAYRVLRDPERRAEYDELHSTMETKNVYQFPLSVEPDLDEEDAVSDADILERVLLLLYKKRRETPGSAGMVEWMIEETIEGAGDNFEFHIWYLKSKGFIEGTEEGTLAITVEGVDHVMSTSRAKTAEKLFITRDKNAAG